MTKDDLKRKEKEEQMRLEEEKKEQERLAAIELEKVKVEEREFSRRLRHVKHKFESAGEGIVNTFKTYDTNNDGTLTLNEFTSAMTKAKVFVNPEEILFIYQLIDEDNSDSISYKELTDVLFGRRKIDMIKLIKDRRHKLGLDTGITEEEIAQNAKYSKKPTVDDHEIRSAGTVDGMSSIMRRSDQEVKQKATLVDEGEHIRNKQEIKELLLEKAFSFEDILQQMDSVKPGNEDKITLADFEKVVAKFCGS
jgi:Ca2+-binding EF-hand superfamily protein